MSTPTHLPPPAAPSDDPVLAAALSALCTATTARTGWAVALDGDALRVAAARGALADRARGLVVPVGGSAGFVAASGHPIALAPRQGDAHVADGVLGALGTVPTALLSLPCLVDGDVVGVVELIDREDGGRFGFDDVELGTLLAAVVGAALVHGDAAAADVPRPDRLVAQLVDLEHDDPVRYRRTAWAIQQLLSS